MDVEDKDIVIGMLQSISMKDYPRDIFEDFGHCIIDEVHHISSRVFSQALLKIATRYMLGLSATPERKDGLTKVIEWFLGPIILKVERKSQIPTVRFIEAQYDSIPIEKFNKMGKANVPEMITDVVNDSTRNQIISQQIEKLLTHGRKILILTDRRRHCELLSELVPPDRTWGLYIGGMKKEDLDISNTQEVIIATYSMACEGYDCPDLDTLIMASSKSDIEQSVGRILRKKNDNPPLVIDIVDTYSVFLPQYYKRKKFYKQNGIQIDSLSTPRFIPKNVEKSINCKKITQCLIVED